ncbi:MAG: hypothetical protein Q8M08_08450 [Bacteroidales bacterium]|nr:hypothetical protein [Bacteroidales bacterium]
MKKILAILVIVFFSTMSYAQWFGGPGNLYMTGGNVGVGTVAPATLIHGMSAGNSTLRMESSYAGAGLQTMGQFQAKSTENGDLFIMAFRHNAGGYSDMLQSVYHSTYPGGGFAEFMYFRFDTQEWQMRTGVIDAKFGNSGKVSFENPGGVAVGMGALPIPAGAKVAIGGKVVCKEIEVTLTGMPDYVFNSDYKLLSLYDVENFINVNKHLPGVPSESEVVANGLNLGDMNATLLMKVEELTLYMIDLKKENDALKTRVSNLEK